MASNVASTISSSDTTITTTITSSYWYEHLLSYETVLSLCSALGDTNISIARDAIMATWLRARSSSSSSSCCSSSAGGLCVAVDEILASVLAIQEVNTRYSI